MKIVYHQELHLPEKELKKTRIEEKEKYRWFDITFGAQTNILAAYKDKSTDHMIKIVESFKRIDQDKKGNHHKLNDKLHKIEVLTYSQR